MILLSIGHLANAQFIYFNNLYEVEEQTNSLNYKILKRNNNQYLNIGHMIQLSNNVLDYGTILRAIDADGIQLNRQLQEYIFTPSVATLGSLKESVIQLSNGNIALYHSVSNGMNGSVPFLICLNSELDTVWTQRIMIGATPPNASGGANAIAGVGLTNLSDSTFMLLTYNQWGDVNNQDSIKLRYLTFDYNGNVLANHLQYLPPYWEGAGIRKISDTELILWGKQYFNGDRQIIVWKMDMTGAVTDSLAIGNNAFHCNEGFSSALYHTSDNKLVLAYMWCLEDNGFPNTLYEAHVAVIDAINLDLLEEHVYNITGLDAYSGGAGFEAIIPGSDNGYIAIANNNIGGMNNAIKSIIKLDDSYNIVWQANYTSGYNFLTEVIFDITVAHDGGYICTGTTEIITETADLMQKNWLLKIDACGYEEPMGCPAIVGVDENNPSLQLHLWPNPVYNLLKAVLPVDAHRIFITDMTGRIVQEEKVYYPNQQFDVSQLATGVYLFNVECDDGRVMGEGVVKR